MEGRNRELVESVFVRAIAPFKVADAERYCAALQLTWDLGDADGDRRRVPTVAVDDDVVVLGERIEIEGHLLGELQRQVQVQTRLDEFEFVLDGLPLGRYVRWFADDADSLGAVAFAHDRSWKIDVIVFEPGAEIGGSFRKRVDPDIVVSLIGAFGSYDSWASFSYHCGGPLAWKLAFRDRPQPLAPRGIAQIQVRYDDGRIVVLDPVDEPARRSDELVELLQHGDPEIVRLDFGEQLTAEDVVLSIELDDAEPDQDLLDRCADEIAKWVQRWNEHGSGDLALRVDHADPRRAIGTVGVELVASVHELSARLLPTLRRRGRTATIRTSIA